MKGTIAKCLQDLVISRFGKDKWQQTLAAAGLPKEMTFMPISDVDDAQMSAVIDALCKNLGISFEEAADAFGDYWVNVYSQDIYDAYYKGHDARSFLLTMDDVHKATTKRMQDARPPRFEYEWKDDNTLIMRYESHRGLIDFAVGLAKGVGRFFKEDIKVRKIDDEHLEIIFPS